MRRCCDPCIHRQQTAEPCFPARRHWCCASTALPCETENKIAVCISIDICFPMQATHRWTQLCRVNAHYAHTGTAHFFKTGGIKDKRDRKIQSIWALISSDTTVSKLGPQVDVQVALQLPHMGGFLLALCNGPETGEGQQQHCLHLLGYIFIPNFKKLLIKLSFHSLNILFFFQLLFTLSLGQASWNLAEIPWRSVGWGWTQAQTIPATLYKAQRPRQHQIKTNRDQIFKNFFSHLEKLVLTWVYT